MFVLTKCTRTLNSGIPFVIEYNILSLRNISHIIIIIIVVRVVGIYTQPAANKVEREKKKNKKKTFIRLYVLLGARSNRKKTRARHTCRVSFIKNNTFLPTGTVSTSGAVVKGRQEGRWDAVNKYLSALVKGRRGGQHRFFSA